MIEKTAATNTKYSIIPAVKWCFRPRFCTVRLYWAWDNLGYWNLICYESCPWCRIDRSTCWSAVQHATNVPCTLVPAVNLQITGCTIPLHPPAYMVILEIKVKAKDIHIIVQVGVQRIWLQLLLSTLGFSIASSESRNIRGSHSTMRACRAADQQVFNPSLFH